MVAVYDTSSCDLIQLTRIMLVKISPVVDDRDSRPPWQRNHANKCINNRILTLTLSQASFLAIILRWRTVNPTGNERRPDCRNVGHRGSGPVGSAALHALYPVDGCCQFPSVLKIQCYCVCTFRRDGHDMLKHEAEMRPRRWYVSRPRLFVLGLTYFTIITLLFLSAL